MTDNTVDNERLAAIKARLADAEALLALVREEAAKNNSPYGRSNTLALNNIRNILDVEEQPYEPWR